MEPAMSTRAANKITVEIRTPEGESTSISVSPHEVVEALRNQAITALGLRPAAGVQYFLFRDGARLAGTASLTEAGIVEGSVLVLAAEPQVGAEQ
jgi:hypothetical protein